MNCQKYRYKAIKQKEGWLKQIPDYIKYFHVLGDPTIEENYILNEEDNLLIVKTEDDYNSLPKKVISAFEAINNEYKYKYIFKTDDDQLLKNVNFFDTIIGILNNRDKKINYGGYIIDVKQPYFSQYHKIHPELPEYYPILQTKYCSGRFYLLSNNSIKYLLNKKEGISKEYLEDYSIGLNLSIELKENMLNITTNKYFVDSS